MLEPEPDIELDIEDLGDKLDIEELDDENKLRGDKPPIEALCPTGPLDRALFLGQQQALP